MLLISSFVTFLLVQCQAPLAEAGIISRGQLTFPPTTGPCRQDAGLEPLQCTDSACLDIPASGICNIQAEDGLPICGCCDSTVTLNCDACGGDAGGGFCSGSGAVGIAYQGCPCSIDGGDVPNDDDNNNACPEDRGEATQLCSSNTCGGDTIHNGTCDSRTDLGSGLYRFCSCCPDNANLDCGECGGDAGGGRCEGIEQYSGYQYANCSCTVGGGGNTPVPIPIPIPFPIPPIGFPPPPPGTPNPKERCSDTVDVKCSDCGGNSGWCQEGDSAGCPCEDTQCPPDDNPPECSDAICGGAIDSDIISSCKGDSEGNNKGCACSQLTPDSLPYTPFSLQELVDQQNYLANLQDIVTPPPSQPSPPPSQGTGVLTCSGNSVNAVPAALIETTGDVTPNQLLYTLRQMLCNNQCGEPAGLPQGVAWSTGSKTSGDCEISVSVAGGIEAYMYRETESVGVQWQQCWDSTQNIIEQCVNEGPNTGWVNGPAPYQFYKGGFRPLNDKSAIHAPMSGESLQSTIATGAVAPTKLTGFTCGSGTGGTQPAACLDILGSIVKGNVLDATDTTKSICTDDSTCLQSGNTGSADGKTVFGQYCEVAASSGCSFVIATKDKRFGGFPGRSCVSPAEMSDFIRLGANTCGANQAQGVWAAGFSGDQVAGFPYTAMGLVDATNAGVLYVP